MIEAPDLSQDGIRHGFFTREGGVSQGIYAALNCGPGSGDDPEAVVENRDRVARRLGWTGADLLSLHQVHSATVVTVEQPWAPGERPRADAMVTDRPGLVLGVLAADCAPILFADPEARVVGAAHSGWRGAVARIGVATVEAMEQLGARRERIRAVVGPCIGPDSYEVGPDLVAAATAAAPENARFFRPGAPPDRSMFDLKGLIGSHLSALGLAAVRVMPDDTLADEQRFFSYRRTTQRGEPDYGRMISAIVLD